MLKKTFILTLISVLLIGIFSPLFGPEILVFGPKQYTRNKGKPITETDNFISSITGPDFTLRVINGDAQGGHRVSSATVVLNGEQILGPSDFNQQIGVIERTVSINSNNEISVTLKSKPGSFITISILNLYPGPTANISASPANILLGESSTLTWSTSNAHTVSIDQGIGNVDLNGSIDVSPTETTTYTLTATGYGGTASASVTVNVQVDQTPPSITISSPESGAQYDTLPISVSATYEDSGSGINQSSVKVTLNGNDITSDLTITESSVSGEISNEALLQSGSNTLVVEVADNAGNAGSESVQFEYQEIQQEDMTIIYGRVFEAGTENPLSDAIVTSSGNTSQSDSDGYWKLVFGSGGTYKIKITKDGYTEVYRKIYLETGKEGVVDNAYLTIRDTKTTAIGPDGGTHSNSDGTVEVIIPQGALNEVKDIQATRLLSSKALPGDLNETDNLEYPISFLFCADFGPDDIIFTTPVTIRVQNTWGFDPGFEIPCAYWDKTNLKWVSTSGMATVDTQGQWIEAAATHFSPYDFNPPSDVAAGDGNSDWDGEGGDEPEVCVASSVNPHNGVLKNSFSVPGVKVKGHDTGLSFTYNSQTAYPSYFMKVYNYHENSLVNRPNYLQFKVNSALVGSSSASSGIAGGKQMFLNSPTRYGAGGLIFKGIYPSGRVVKTGYQEINLEFTSHYPGFYAATGSWGGVPISKTTVPSTEDAYFETKISKRIFMVNRKNSQFGQGWSINGIKRLVVDGNRIVMVNGNGSYQEYEQGIDYADIDQGASIISSSETILNQESMLMQKVAFKVNRKTAARFDYGDNARPATGTNQQFVVDLGDEKTIYTIGIEFPGFWKINNVWDQVKISTSVDNTNWTLWYSYGEPTLQNPEDTTDPLDFHIQSPFIISGTDRSVRYIKFELGYPAINSIHVGSGIEKVYAIGSESLYRNIDGLKWPQLEYDSNTSQFTLTEFSSEQTIFDSNGKMIEKKNRQGRAITYQYNGDNISRIQYPEGVYMDFVYNAGGFISKVIDSTGRETNISTDSNGNIVEVIYPDSTTREFGYNDRGLMTMDKNGDAVKTYTWNENWPVLEKITLPNSGERIIDSWINDSLLNDLESSETSLVNFPYDSSTLKQESTITLEDGAVRKYVSENEYLEQYLYDQLQERTYYGITNKRTLPYKIENGISQHETTNIYYDDNLQLKKVETTLNDTKWGKVDSDPNAHYEPKADTLTAKTNTMEVSYNADFLVSNVKAYGINNTFTYDVNKNLIQSYDEIRLKTTSYTYDTNNNLIRIDSPGNIKNEMVYNSLGLIMEVINNDDTKTVVTRNNRGEIASITDEENRTVAIDRDIMGRVIKETSPGGRIVEYQWGGTGCTSCGSALKLTKIIDSGTKTWEFTYDIMGNPIEMIYPDGTKIVQTYDIASHLNTFTNKRGQVIDYAYDSDGKLTEKTTPEGVIYFSYDDRNRITDIEATDYHYQYEYGLADTFILQHLPIVKETNLLNNKWSEYISTYEGLPFEYFDSFYWRKVYEYRFDSSAGTPPGPTPTKVQYFRKYAAGNYTTWYEYDNGYRVLKETQSYLGRDMTFSYNNRLLLRKRYYEYQYSGFPFIEMNFSRDNSGLITSITGDKALTAIYNPDLEIQQVQHTAPQVFDEGYTYDTRGNRLSSLTNSYTYNDLNQLTDTNTHNYTYDLDGNMIEEKNIATTETKKFYYSSENRMIKYEYYPTEVEPADIVAEYKYDIYGRRIQKNVNGVIINFHWEGDNMSFELNDSYQPIRRYIYENGKDDVQAHVEYSEVDDPQYFSFERKGWYSYIKDQVGTITKVYKHETKQMVDTRTYDTFGNIINQSGSSSGNLGFQSKYYDQESGLNYYYHRYYHPQIGRFINEDPIGFNGGINLYSYVENNPVNNFDFFGLKIICKPKSNNWYLCPGFYSNDPGTLIDVIYKTKWKLLKQVYMDPIFRAGYIGYFEYVGIFKFSKYLKYIKLCFDFKCCDTETGRTWIKTEKRKEEKIHIVQERLPDIVPENWQEEFPSAIPWGKYHWETHDW